MKSVLLGSALCMIWGFMLSGCAQMRIYREKPPHDDQTQSNEFRPTHETESENLLMGTIRMREAVHLSQICPNQWKSVSTRMNFEDALFSIFAVNIISTWQVDVECVPGTKK